METRTPSSQPLDPRNVHPHRARPLWRISFQSPLSHCFSTSFVSCWLWGFRQRAIIVTYYIECFTHYPAEAGIVMNFYRLSFGTTRSYFITPRVTAVWIQWTLGMSAFFVLGSFGLVVLLMFKGESSRHMQSTRIAYLKRAQSCLTWTRNRRHGCILRGALGRLAS